MIQYNAEGKAYTKTRPYHIEKQKRKERRRRRRNYNYNKNKKPESLSASAAITPPKIAVARVSIEDPFFSGFEDDAIMLG